ncbi:type II toxin-antitoxin system PemK/MazF family toxin [Bacteroidota bacterium]
MKRGEIWLISLDPAIGAEIKKTRPAIIVNDDELGKLPLKVIVPVTDWKEKFAMAPWMVKIIPDKRNNLDKISSVDCFQIRSISEQRFVKKIGFIDNDIMIRIEIALTKVLNIF